MPYPESAPYPFAPDGTTVLAPTNNPGGQSRDGQAQTQIIIEGVVEYEPTGERFDALYGTDATGAFAVPHSYLRWTPIAPVLEASDLARHRYVFRVPETVSGQAAGLGARWDIDRFVDRYLVPPSEVRAGFQGAFTLTVELVPVALPPVWPAVAAVGVPVAVVAGGLAVVIRRRMTLAGLSPDLQVHLGHIETRLKAARRALRPEDRRLVPVAERLTSLHTGTVALVRQLQNLRNAQREANRPRVESDLAMLERQRDGLTDADAQREAEAAIAAKRRTLAVLNEMQEAESRCRMRLAKLEATLDATLVSLRQTQSTTAEATAPALAEDALCRALDAEVSALHEAAYTLSQSEPARSVQALGLTSRPS